MDRYTTADAVLGRGRSDDPEVLSKLEADCEFVMNEFHKGRTRVLVSDVVYRDKRPLEFSFRPWVSRILNRINERLVDANQKARCSLPKYGHQAFVFAIPE